MKVIETDDPRAEESFAALYKAAYGRIVRYAARRTDSDAEDIAAEVFRIAWTRTCEGVDVTTGWLFVTAENVLRNHRRSAVRAQRLRTVVAESLHDDPPPETDAVLLALDRLDDESRSLLMLRYWDELSGAELASVLGISTSAVWVRLHRARRAFRATYGKDPS
ncbi:MAG: sigma-70 family RNA polymerase sigma factor [Cellulomonas sp.]